MPVKQCYEPHVSAAGPFPVQRECPSMNPLVPLGILFLLPLTAIGLVLYTDTGIMPSLFWSAVKTTAILAVVGGAISFVASRLAEKSSNG